MQRTLIRACTIIIAATIVITSANWASEPATAALLTPPNFTFTVFPHLGDEVAFRDSWGARRPGGRRHEGTDIISPRGTPIVAVADGTVTRLGNSRASGYNIRIDHGNGWATSYLHLNNDTIGTDDGEGGTWTAFYPTLMEGDTVTAGQVIGYVGDSGNAEQTVPHTHFALSFDGTKTNPYPYLQHVFERERRFIDPTDRPI